MERVMGRTDTSRALAPTLTLPLLTLYGLGVTIGAGIYILIGAAVGHAGPQAVVAFLAAAVVMGLTGASFAELAGRMPVSSGEAAYVLRAFGSAKLAALVGLLVLAVALVSAAAIAKGAAGYLRVFVPWSEAALVVLIVMALGAIAAFGTREALWVAAVMTVVEVGGLLAIVVGGLLVAPQAVVQGVTFDVPPLADHAAWRGLMQAFLLAFFAFIGFEAIVNLAEESHAPARIIPRAILWTLAVATLLYCAVTATAMAVVPADVLASSPAPLTLVFEHTTRLSPMIIAAIAVVATTNGVVAQLILGARLLYGLARQDHVPDWLARVHPWTGTPLLATAIATAITLALASFQQLDRLAQWTSQMMLVIFLLVNAALVAIKVRDDPAPWGCFLAPLIVPVLGTLTTAAVLIATIFFAVA